MGRNRVLGCGLVDYLARRKVKIEQEKVAQRPPSVMVVRFLLDRWMGLF